MKRQHWVPAAIFGAIALVAVVWFSTSKPHAVPATDAPPEDDEPEGELGAFFEEPFDLAAADAGFEARGPEFERRFRDMTPEERRAMRAEWRERFRNMPPEERRRRMARRIRIEPLGDTPTTLEPEEVAEAMRASRRAARDCVRDNGGFRALREAMGGRGGRGDAGRGGFSMSFEVGPTGAVDPSSIVLDPAPPAPFYDCFAEAISQTQMPAAGGDGAKVEMDLGRGRRGGRRGPPRE